MRQLALAALIACALPAAAPAQEGDAPGAQSEEDGGGFFSDRTRRMLEGLLDEVGPAMRDMLETMRGWDLPGLGVDDLSNYHTPEVLPNGDILIRRKDPEEFDVPPWVPDDPDNSVDL